LQQTCSKRSPIGGRASPTPIRQCGPPRASWTRLRVLQAPFEVARLDRRRTNVSTTAAIVPASPGVITPPASAEVTAFIAVAMSWAFSPRGLSRGALSIGGNANLTVRSRQGGKMRSRQSRIAVGSPTRASSTTLRVSAGHASLFPLFYLVEIRHPQLLQ
jgi:hypothetical protein